MAGQQLFSEALIPPHVGLPGSPGQSMNVDSYCELLAITDRNCFRLLLSYPDRALRTRNNHIGGKTN